jgi:hypothetical protein
MDEKEHFCMSRARILLSCLLACPLLAFAQQPQTPAPDAITFQNGDRISGKITGTTSRGLIFRSLIVGEITVEWSNIRDVHSENGFSWVTGVPGPNAPGIVGPGTPAPPVVAATPVPPPPPAAAPAQPPQIARAEPAPAPAPAPVAPAPASAAAPEKDRHLFPGVRLFKGWQGVAAAGISYVAATTSVSSFTPTVSLERDYRKTSEAWPLRGRTYINFLVNYSKETQSGDVAYFDPVSRTVIIPGSFMKTYTMHADIDEDYFLFPRLFVQGGAIFDHSYAQSLDLLQSYGGGLGFVVYHTDRSEFDLRAGVGYARQQYVGFPRFDTSVIGSRFYENYQHRFANGMSFSEQGGIRPAWTASKYLFGGGQLSFNMPIYHHLNLNVSSFDFYSRTPPPMLKKNVFQIAVGVGYSF